MAASLQGRESGSKVAFTVEAATRQWQVKTVTENTSLCVIVNCEV
jgi:hypothetical protein